MLFMSYIALMFAVTVWKLYARNKEESLGNSSFGSVEVMKLDPIRNCRNLVSCFNISTLILFFIAFSLFSFVLIFKSEFPRYNLKFLPSQEDMLADEQNRRALQNFADQFCHFMISAIQKGLFFFFLNWTASWGDQCWELKHLEESSL